MRTVVNKGINTRWFKRVLKDNDLSQREYARRIKEDPTTVNRMFRGTRHFRLEDVRRFSEITGAPVDAVLENAGLNLDAVESERAVKVAGWIDGERVVHYGRSPGSRFVITPPDMANTVLAFIYTTEGAEHGAVLYCQPPGELNMDMVDRWCVVQMGDGKEYVRVLKRGVRQGRFDLHNACGSVTKDAGVVAAAIVEWVKY